MTKNSIERAEFLKNLMKTEQNTEEKRKIKVIGVGGGGCSTVNRMIKSGLSGIEFWLMNTDKQLLEIGQTDNKILLGAKSTEGLGAGGDPSVGEKAAEEAQQEIKESLKGADMVFITAGLGGGTGTGATPVIAKIAKELGILTVAVVTKPFTWEGRRRNLQAEYCLENFRESADAVIVVSNDKLLNSVDRQVSLTEAFSVVDEVLLRCIQSVYGLIAIPGIINIEFADVKRILQNSGSALMGIGTATGDDRAIRAAKNAINSQLLEHPAKDAKGIIVSITGGEDMSLHEIADVANIVQDAVKDDVAVILGAIVKEETQAITVTVIATGVDI